uniref:Type I ribosome-inactivating protein trichoanguina n=1 Tax=Trichosanthes anguina TaxID=50544 RepID=RIP1_TRIAN|nr:RecName: Full=Type I ribosome-inactivating protein trichoanguina; Short=RIP; AltName: Full=Trichoanguin; AltName: Full=rRNA N-glycosidase; Flags: Precursor [Trichosanthes anguina]AAD02686.1 trichoanguin [Trichosanthes cucumerina]
MALSFFFLAISLGSPTAIGDVSFDLSTATKKSYSSFITQLRDALPTQGTVCGIPLLPSTASGSQWFRFFNLTNYNDETVTVAVNVTNVYIVAYRADAVSYFFEDTPAEAFKLIFAGTKTVKLPYSGNYDKLQSVVGKQRDMIELGIPALSSAITNMVYYDYQSTAAALLVLIQCTAEAARYKYIEQQVSSHISSNFYPNQAVISLENKWGALSKQIQIANRTGHGQFENPVELYNPDGTRFSVTNTSAGVVKGNIKLLLYYKASVGSEYDIPTTILHPGAMGMLHNQNGNYVTM